MLYVLGQSNPNCVLIVENKEEFIEDLNKFYVKNSEIWILEYELDSSRLKPDFDWSNRTDQNVFQSWRWFRTKEINTPQLHLYSQVYLFDMFSHLDIITSKFKKTKVVLSANPAKCLDEIIGNDMTLFLRDSLLHDFNMTSRTRSLTDTEICSTHTERSDSFDFTYRIKNSSITIANGDYPKIQFFISETENGNLQNNIVISKEGMKNTFYLNGDNFNPEFDQIYNYRISDFQMETNLDHFYRQGETIMYNPRSFVNYLFSSQESLKYTDRPKCCCTESPPAAMKKALHYAAVFKNKLYNTYIIKHLFNPFIKVLEFLNNGTFHILESADLNNSSVKIIEKNGRLHLFIKNGFFYIKEDNTIYVSKDIIYHLLRAAYIKTFNKLLSIMIFLTSILLVIGALGQFDFFTATQQVFITFGTGVLPFVFNILFSNKIYKRAPDIECQHQITHNIQSYAESCQIHDIQLRDLIETDDLPVDVAIVIQCEETDIFRLSDNELNIPFQV
ncbi:hypothetical protein Btru_043585 [Bulinus truncatus]|nr:hypothetical protein Btru_043585 [Bulinus truncatus]